MGTPIHNPPIRPPGHPIDVHQLVAWQAARIPTKELLKEGDERYNPILTEYRQLVKDGIVDPETGQRLKKIKITPDAFNRPLEERRDFSRFPFERLPLDEEDKKDLDRQRCFKFKTSYYTAYVSENCQDGITPEHLECPTDSHALREARRCIWGRLPWKDHYEIQTLYPAEYQQVSWEHTILSSHLPPPSEVPEPKIITILKDPKVQWISATALSAIGAAALFFFPFYTVTSMVTMVIVYKKDSIYMYINKIWGRIYENRIKSSDS